MLMEDTFTWIEVWQMHNDEIMAIFFYRRENTETKMHESAER